MRKFFTRFIALLVAVLMLAGCSNGGAPAATTDTPAPIVAPPPPAAPEEPIEVPEFEIDMQTIAALNIMQPVYDSLMRALRDQPAEWAYYVTDNSVFFWNTLYYLCANYGEQDSRNTLDGAQLLVPFEVMEEYAAACFFEFVALLPLTDENFGITIDEAAEAYRVDMSDKGEDYVTPFRYDYTASDTYEVMVAWLSPGEEYPDMLGAYTFVLAANQYNIREGLSEALYPFSVQYVSEVYTDLVLLKDTYERDGKQYAVIDPVLRRYYNAFDLDENGEPYGEEWEDIANDEEESIEVIVSKLAEFEIQEMGWMFEDIVLEDALEDPLAFFMENAKRKFEGEPLLFEVNVYDNVLYFAHFVDDYYFLG